MSCPRTAVLLVLGAAPLAAQDAPVLTSAQPDAVGVTIYRGPSRGADEALDLSWLQGYALITETRTVDLPAGRSTVRFEGVAGGMMPESALVAGLPHGVREKNLDADLLSPASLYARSLGRPVTLRRTDERSGKVVEERAVIRSGPDGAAVLQTKDGFLAADCGPQTEELVYSELPKGLSSRPTLSVEMDSPAAQRVTLTLSYLAWGFDWQSNYVLRTEPDGRHAALTGWVTLASSDPTSFPDASAAVVGGSVHREDERGYYTRGEYAGELDFKCFFHPVEMPPPPAPPPPAAPMEMGYAEGDIVVTAMRRSEMLQSAPVAITAVEEELGDLKLYRVPIPTTVAANAQKQVALFDRKRIEVKIIYRVDVDGDSLGDLKLGLDTRNRKQEGLGLALPGGQVTVFSPQGEESLLVGEAGLADKAVDEDIELELADATQVTAEINDLEGGKDWQDHELVVRNANPWPARFEARLYWDRDSYRLGKLSARLVPKDGRQLWQVTVPANGEARLRYRLTEVE